MVTNISEETAASIFMIEVSQGGKIVIYGMGLDVSQWKSADHFILTPNLLSMLPTIFPA
jgi:hypothetical protein